jgi:cytochrome b
MNTSDQSVIVWDLPIRLFHWLTAALVIAAYVTWRLNWMDLHARAGEALLALVLFRLLWGFFGSETARFSAFLTWPRTALRHLAHFFRREPDRQVGHNPAGGYMILLLLALLLAETLTGLYIDNDVADHGPLTELVPARIANLITDLHLYFWNALLAAAILHVVVIAFYAAVKRHDLVTPMITGRKMLPQDIARPRLKSAARATVLLAASVLAAVTLANYL